MASTRLTPPVPLPPYVLGQPVDGLNIAPGSTLSDVLGDGPTLLVFLRHHG